MPVQCNVDIVTSLHERGMKQDFSVLPMSTLAPNKQILQLQKLQQTRHLCGCPIAWLLASGYTVSNGRTGLTSSPYRMYFASLAASITPLPGLTKTSRP